MRHRRPRRSPAAAALVASGMAELAAGALTGWVYTLATTQPDAAKRIGLKSTPRVRQWHLDLAMLGTAAVAAGTAVPDAPARAALPLAVGCWTNAMLFLPLAVKTDLDEHPAYQGAAVASFVTTTVGFTRMAACAWRNR